MAIYNEKDKSKWTKDGRHWYFRTTYKDINNKTKYYKSKKYIDRETAINEELKFKTKIHNPALVKFNVVASEYLDNLYKTKKESTAYTYEKDYNKHLKPYFKTFYINDINIRIIKNWHEEMEKKNFSINYLNKLHTILVNIFDYAIKNYDLEINIAKQYGRFERKNDKVIDDKDKIKYITLEEFNKFIKVVNDPLWRMFFIFLMYTGMRKGEVMAINWKDIDFKNKVIIVNKTLSTDTKKGAYKITTTKNYLNRKVKMSKFLIEELIKYKEHVIQFKDFKESWFVFGNSRFLPRSNIDRYKKNYFNLVDDVNEITVHEFRHSHVSMLINEYVKKCNELNLKIDTTKFFLMMANRMGHTVDTMQKTYMHLFPTIQDEIVELLDNL